MDLESFFKTEDRFVSYVFGSIVGTAEPNNEIAPTIFGQFKSILSLPLPIHLDE